MQASTPTYPPAIRYALMATGIVIIAYLLFLIIAAPVKLKSDMRGVRDHLTNLVSNGRWWPEFTIFPVPDNSAGPGLRVLSPDDFDSEFFAVLLKEPEGRDFTLRLLDLQGREIHAWPVTAVVARARNLADGDFVRFARFKILDDWSILVNFAQNSRHRGLLRISACGAVIWDNGAWSHHEISLDPDGGAWTWVGSESSLHEHDMALFDIDTGSIEERHSLTSIINLNEANLAAFGFQEPFVPERQDVLNFMTMEGDPFHPNDVEPLDARMAGSFPAFDAGDLLVSFRHNHMVAVIDRISGEVLWSMVDPWRFQHDPEFRPSGDITVFNNGAGGKSSILSADPVTGEVTRLEGVPADHFATVALGSLSHHGNGRTLVVVPAEGRAIVFDRLGQVALEFNNTLNEDHNALVLDAELLDPADFGPTPVCP